MKRILSIFIIAVVFLSACRNKSKKLDIKTSQTNYDIINISMSDFKPSENAAIESVKYIPIKEAQGSFFAEINKVHVTDSAFFLMDMFGANSLFKFDKKGNFKMQFGAKGGGPGEYFRLADFDVDSENNVYLLDITSRRLLKFDQNGKFLLEKDIPFGIAAFKLLGHDKYIFNTLDDNINQQILITDTMFNIKHAYLNYSKKDLKNKYSSNLFHRIEGKVIYNKPLSDSVFVFSNDGLLEKCYYFDFGKNRIKDELRNDYEKVISYRKVNDDIVYFYDTPLIVNNNIIGNVFIGNRKGDLSFNTNKKTFKSTEYIENELTNKNFFFTLGYYNGDAIGYIDLEIYNNLKEKPNLGDGIQHLNDGGRYLAFYQISQNDK